MDDSYRAAKRRPAFGPATHVRKRLSTSSSETRATPRARAASTTRVGQSPGAAPRSWATWRRAVSSWSRIEAMWGLKAALSSVKPSSACASNADRPSSIRSRSAAAVAITTALVCPPPRIDSQRPALTGPVTSAKRQPVPETATTERPTSAPPRQPFVGRPPDRQRLSRKCEWASEREDRWDDDPRAPRADQRDLSRRL